MKCPVLMSAFTLPMVAMCNMQTLRNARFDFESTETCEIAFQTYYLQDVSWSFDDDVTNIRQQVPDFVDFLQNFNGSSFSMGTFTDMPFPDVGFTAYSPNDYCHKPLVNFTMDSELVADKLLNLRILNGGDKPEVGLTSAGMIAMQSLYWDNNPFVQDADRINMRIIIITTDAEPHLDGDLSKELERHPFYWSLQSKKVNFGPQPTGEMPTYTVLPNNNDGELLCGAGGMDDLVYEEYLSLEQFAAAMTEGEAIPIFFVTEKAMPKYNEIVTILREEYDTFSFVMKIEDDSSDLASTFQDSIAVLKEVTCGSPPLPTEDPVVPDDTCDGKPTADFLFLQDVTGSFENDIPHVRELLPQVMDDLSGRFRSVRMGLAAFADKPVAPFGDKPSGDFCYKLINRLGDNREEFLGALNELTTHSGVDWPECQMEALLAAAAREETLWTLPGFTLDGEAVLRLLVIATDSGYHVAGDGAAGGLTRQNAGTGYFDELKDDYPTTEQVLGMLKAKELTPMFLVTEDLRPVYDALKTDWEAKGLMTIVQTISEDSSNIAQSILDGVEELCSSDEMGSTITRSKSAMAKRALSNGRHMLAGGGK